MRKHVDIISTLPDDLLCCIISLLPSKDAIGTSILSKRWKNLMDFVPVLNLTCRIPTPGFINTLDKLFSSTSSSSNLQKLRLQISGCHWYIVLNHVNSWIRSAINRNVAELDVCLPDDVFNTVENDEEFALRVVPSDSLQTLKVRGGLGLRMPYTIGSFKNLKTFWLWIYDPDKELLAKLFCSLPQLETLFIDAYFSKIVKGDTNMCINIIAPALKWLNLSIDQEDYYDVDLKVLIDTPMLEDIILEDGYLAAYLVMSGPSLVTATLDVGMDYYHLINTHRDNRYVRAVELLRGLSNVKSLEINYSASAALDRAFQDRLPILNNLTCLNLDDLPLTGLSLIPRFLESAPNLKEIAVTIQPQVKSIMGWSWKSPTALPTSLLHLEEIEIQGAKIIESDPSFSVMVNYIGRS
ncbi:F-box/LRR-repeat protein At4g14103 isoform X2 [Daucus carota subsp. sativus]|nr:PREDICTED: F-box/LRR-repeat protein At4g14103-like isoform X1 [Daucus carota subsp. sativus]XP_017221237.1 PREDICTED: F-box/LRR-repeat protein At4g14103-like isoform X1 [Daucus carota subsp. sativus]XP_017221238.1 PREDICTED: F-box/LRR-repeat protein At4g14103-like isoform X1 [Daucus carota subsp. sativus]XP_017221239.1 PREDICTED: F-box/LRR-repeat protein At4g14103-like isoform X1 [Daucus carota subsp. sativus]XP_017221240.1 PREDICTED: F-box/LRR-repeat protein At4g14103-like isoform X1 [Daucu